MTEKLSVDREEVERLKAVEPTVERADNLLLRAEVERLKAERDQARKTAIATAKGVAEATGYHGPLDEVDLVGHVHALRRRLQELAESATTEAKDANYKLRYLAKELTTTEGVFTFPDGDYVYTRKGPTAEEQNRALREALDENIQILTGGRTGPLVGPFSAGDVLTMMRSLRAALGEQP